MWASRGYRLAREDRPHSHLESSQFKARSMVRRTHIDGVYGKET